MGNLLCHPYSCMVFLVFSSSSYSVVNFDFVNFGFVNFDFVNFAHFLWCLMCWIYHFCSGGLWKPPPSCRVKEEGNDWFLRRNFAVCQTLFPAQSVSAERTGTASIPALIRAQGAEYPAPRDLILPRLHTACIAKIGCNLMKHVALPCLV